ncbi:site-specific integrase [Clostridium sp. YIM B02515]|uniref:Site-specific integrase n=1 Tax=Clostridium rhizosphaerae TaxID=2803861 RepID=A0ABS1T772_9CLOT|nr:site-specific integrase [Clostridium rhizosphaerae]
MSKLLLNLDCGIRIGEACELKVEDIDLKQRLINVRAEVAKTRTFRQLPISEITAKLL